MDAKLKSILLELVDDIDKVCRANNLQYFLIGGSMLGAVRHKGMIPWDDDIDIGMPREDYEKFKGIASEKLAPHHRFIYNQIDAEYHYFFGKVYHQNTTLIEYKDPAYPGGVFVDIFPLDGLPKNKLLLDMQYWHFDKWRNLASLAALHELPEAASFKVRLKRILKRHLSLSFCLKTCERIANIYSFSKSKNVVNYGGAWRKKEITGKENFAYGIDCEFEGRTLRIPVGYRNILTEVYGDYMKLPPVEKRISHHSHFYINLDRKMSDKEINELLSRP